ncbi:hypothetical protein KAR91_40845 [Candidatus Pacearchaeota archaeon]|nr:hypothetical protein [Candidatus Pacearchaeota archaeon]
MTSAELKKKIVDEFKKEGLDIAEEAVMKIIKVSFRIAPEVFLATENKYDDLTIPFLGILQPIVEKLADKIDGEIG